MGFMIKEIKTETKRVMIRLTKAQHQDAEQVIIIIIKMGLEFKAI